MASAPASARHRRSGPGAGSDGGAGATAGVWAGQTAPQRTGSAAVRPANRRFQRQANTGLHLCQFPARPASWDPPCSGCRLARSSGGGHPTPSARDEAGSWLQLSPGSRLAGRWCKHQQHWMMTIAWRGRAIRSSLACCKSPARRIRPGGHVLLPVELLPSRQHARLRGSAARRETASASSPSKTRLPMASCSPCLATLSHPGQPQCLHLQCPHPSLLPYCA